MAKLPVDQPEAVSSIPSLLSRLRDAGVDSAEPDSVVGACAQANDPLVGNGVAWHLENLGLLSGHNPSSDIGAPAAWDIRTDASGVLVAVIDSGIASSDPELAPSIRAFPGETLGDGIDNDGNGYADDLFGYDFYHDDPTPDDESGHGSMCASLIGAGGGNGFGSTGVAWKASILACKFLNGEGLGTLSDAIDAIDYARGAGADILNLSWSYEGNAALLAEALGRCDAEGIIMVCASGNSGWASPVPAPASIKLPHLVAVAASTAADTLAPFSVVNSEKVHLAAPGVDLPIMLHTHPWDPFADVSYATGTSFSAAIVSGCLALAIAEFPGTPPARTIRKMLETVEPVQGGSIALTSGGRINLAGLLESPRPTPPCDQFAERLLLTDPSGQWSGRNDGATVETVDANLGMAPPPVRSIWFEWTAAADGLLRVEARSDTSHPLRLAVFAKTQDTPGPLIAQTSAARPLEVPVVAGQKLLWMLDSMDEIPQGLRLSWQLPPANDNWATATTATGVPVTLAGNSLGATVESFEQSKSHYQWLPQGSVWWRWTPGVTGTFAIEPSDGHFAFVLPLSGGKPSFPNDYEFTSVIERRCAVEAGRSYAVLAIPQTPAAAGPFSVSLLGTQDVAILVQPKDTSTLAGESVELEVQYATAHLPKVQWFKNGEPIPFATESKLKLSPVNERSFGNYHVTVSSFRTSVQSRTAVVARRFEIPRLIHQTPPRSVVVGQTTDLGASFRSSTDIVYSWRKNGQLIAGATSASLALNNCTLADAGSYSLTATNAAGSALATFQLAVCQTPWNGWVDRTPGSLGRGPVRSVMLDGNTAHAFTTTEWLRSTDGGESWSSTSLPANFVLEAGAVDPNGNALVTGGTFTPYGSYLLSAMWKYTPSAGWQSVQPLLIPPTGSQITAETVQQPTYFDGKWWARANYEYSSRAATSTDGVTWTLLLDPADPGKAMRASNLHRFENCVGITYWTSSPQNMRLYFANGVIKTLSNGYTYIQNTARIGNASYCNNKKFPDGLTTTTSMPTDFRFDSTKMFEGVREGNAFAGLEIATNTTDPSSGCLRVGMFEQTSRQIAKGFSCFAKSGNRWLVGYPDGRLWSGNRLGDVPLYRRSFEQLPGLKAYENEFTCGAFHSSDGAQWQKLGAANQQTFSVVTPLGQGGGKFLHAIQENGNNSPVRRFMSDAIYPSALGPSQYAGSFWSGETCLLGTPGSGGPLSFDVIRDQPPGISIESVTPEASWTSVQAANQWNGKWFVRGSASTGRFLVTSSSGNIWRKSTLPASCVLGKNGGTLIAIESPTRGYFSSDGTAWTSFTPQGLPSLNQTNQPAIPEEIASYRGYYVARYGKAIYASGDGISWSLGSAPLPVSSFKENRHTLLVVTESGQILQPSGDTASGPVTSLPESMQSVTVSLNQPFRYALTAEDADGDLSGVTCLLDGNPVSTLSAAPFVFTVRPGVPGAHAVEFVARDQTGRTSRVTALLTVLEGGVKPASALEADSDLSKAVLFKGSYYRILSAPMFIKSAVCVWEGGNLWRPVSPGHHKPFSLTANDECLVASTELGVLTSQDGVNWNHLGGFGGPFPQGPIVLAETGILKVVSQSGSSWTSMDGVSWTLSNQPPPPVSTAQTDTTVWADPDLGLSPSRQMTQDGGRTWITLPGLNLSSVIAVKDGFLCRSADGVYRILRNDYAFTPVALETSWPGALYTSKADGLVFFGKVGAFLRTTEDGIHFSDYSVPPNETTVSMLRFGGEWIAMSSDMICSSKDLKSWVKRMDFHQFGYTTDWLSRSSIKVSRDGLNGMIFDHQSFPAQRFVMNGNCEITRVGIPTENLSNIPSGKNGLWFKNRAITLDDWYFSSPDRGHTWNRAALYRSPDLQDQGAFPTQWPTHYHSVFTPTGLFAATAQRFITLIPYYGLVVTSDDGVTFTAHPWNAPVPLSDVRRVAASSNLFLAAASNGRILRSVDGLQWTEHQTSPTATIYGLLFFNGRWHASATQGYGTAEVWSSTDGISWSRTFSAESSNTFQWDIDCNAFVAKGVARVYAGSPGWLRSSDGLTWQSDQTLNQSVKTNGFVPKGEHPLGIIGGLNRITIINESTGAVIRNVETGSATVGWIDAVPFLSSMGTFREWTDRDPRLTGISTTAGTFGVGDTLEIEVSAAELSDTSTRIQFYLSTDVTLGSGDDIILAMPAWSDGTAVPGGARRFTVALPPSLAAGRFKVGARMLLAAGTSDAATENNLILTENHPVDVPGYELRLTTVGQGNVTSSTPRTIYPQGARLQLLAMPDRGFTFRGWSGSLVSQESAITVLMNADKQLSVSFTAGHRANIRQFGHGTITGAPADGIVLPGEVLHLTQSPGLGWKSGGWRVDGVTHAGPTLTFEPSSDTVVDALFVPDFATWKATAFASANAGTDDSWDGDPDRDGLSNWQELLLATNPLAPAGIGQMVEKSPDQIRLVFTRPQGPPDRPWIRPEHSDSLTDWTSADSLNMTERILDVRDGRETVELRLPIRKGTNGFFRLRMEALPAGL